MLLLSDTLEKPTLDNLWNYLSHFYETLPPALREQFSFEDAAGIYTEGGSSRLFAICTQYQQVEGLKTLPAGRYLCANCAEEAREQTLQELLRLAQAQYGAHPTFTVPLIVVSKRNIARIFVRFGHPPLELRGAGVCGRRPASNRRTSS